MNNNSSLGFEIKSAIIQQGYLNKEVAEQIGITPQYLSDIVKNRRTPSDNILDKLIKHLNLNRNYAYYLVNRYPPELRGQEVNLAVLNKALDWLVHPHEFTLRKTR